MRPKDRQKWRAAVRSRQNRLKLPPGVSQSQPSPALEPFEPSQPDTTSSAASQPLVDAKPSRSYPSTETTATEPTQTINASEGYQQLPIRAHHASPTRLFDLGAAGQDQIEEAASLLAEVGNQEEGNRGVQDGNDNELDLGGGIPLATNASASEDSAPPPPTSSSSTSPSGRDGLRYRQELARFLEDPALDDQAKVARRLAMLLQFGLIPCPPERHARLARRRGCHLHGGLCTSADHRDLSYAWFSHRSKTPDAMRGMGLNRDGALLNGADNLRNTPRADLLDADHVRTFMEGGVPGTICLDQQNVARQTSIRRTHFDLDSFVALWPVGQGEAQLSGSFRLFAHPTPQKQLKGNIHITLPVDEVDPVTGETKESRVGVHKIPKIFLGCTCGGDDVWLVFPQLYAMGVVRMHDLPHAHYEMLYNHVIHPALKPLGIPQGIPCDFEQLMQDARRKSFLYIDLPKAGIRALSRAMASIDEGTEVYTTASDRRNAPAGQLHSLAGLRDAYFLVDSFNLKPRYFAQTLDECLEAWCEEKTASLPRGPNAEQQLFDFATEWAPATEQRGYVALARTCCLRNTLLFLYGGVGTSLLDADPDGIVERLIVQGVLTAVQGGSHTEYPIHLLRDVCSTTSEPTHRHTVSVAGLRYAQMYTDAKRGVFRNKVIPFSHFNLPHLLRSTPEYETWAAATGYPSRRDAAFEAEAEDRKNLNHNLLKFLEETGTFRLEFRATLELWRLVIREIGLVREGARAIAERLAGPQDAVVDGWAFDVEPAGAYYVLSPRVYGTFRLGYLHNLTLLMDCTFATWHYRRYTPPAAETLFAYLVTMVKHFITALPFTHSGFLHYPLVPENPEKRPGLGLKDTMIRRGFGFWPAGMVDWKAFRIQDEHCHLIVPEFRMTPAYATIAGLHQTGGHFFGALERLRLHLARWVQGEGRSRHLAQMWGLYLIGIIQREYRRTVLQRLLGKAKSPEAESLTAKDTVAFTWRGLGELSRYGIRFAYHSPSNAFKSPENIFHWAFIDQHTYGGETKQRYSRDETQYEFRSWFAAVDELLSSLKLPLYERPWSTMFHEAFWTYHTCIVLPGPKGRGLTDVCTGKDKGKIKAWLIRTSRVSGTIRAERVMDRTQADEPKVHRRVVVRDMDQQEDEWIRELADAGRPN